VCTQFMQRTTVHVIRSRCACRPPLPASPRCAGLPMHFAKKMLSSVKLHDDAAAAKPLSPHPLPTPAHPTPPHAAHSSIIDFPESSSQQIARPLSHHAGDQQTKSGVDQSVVAAENGGGNPLDSPETRQTHVERRRCSQGIIRCVARETLVLTCARPFERAAAVGRRM